MSTFQTMQMRSALFSIFFSILVFLPRATSIHACGFSPESEELRFMLFSPDLLHNKAWWAFFYNERSHYLDGQVVSYDDEDILTREWINKLEIDADRTLVRKLLFQSPIDSSTSHPVFEKLLKQTPFRKYYEIAKQCEQVADFGDPWEDQGVFVKRDENRKSLIETLEKIYNGETDPFYVRKYAFQLLRLAYYDENRSVFDNYYKKHFVKGQRDVLFWWGTHYQSMMLDKRQQVDSANYLHALVFSNSTNKMLVSKTNFSKRNSERVLSLAQNDKERADIYLLMAVINPGRALEEIQQVYRLFPEHRHLPLLLTREINKVEDWLGTSQFITAALYSSRDDNDMQNRRRDAAHAGELLRLMEQMGEVRNAPKGFHTLAISYLNLLLGNVAKAKSIFAPSDADPEVVFLIRGMELLAIVQSQDVRMRDTQDHIGRIYDLMIKERHAKFEGEKFLFSLSSYLRYVFREKGLNHLAGLFDNYAVNKFCTTCHNNTFAYEQVRYFDKDASISDVRKVLALFDKSDLNTLEEILLMPYSNKNYLFDVLSVKLLREGRVEEALDVLKNVPDEFWYSFYNAVENLNLDPFRHNTSLLTAPGMTTYNKREILERMVSLEKDISSDHAHRALQLFQLANAWYNFSDHAWFMISYGWTSGTTTDPAHAAFARQMAQRYYEKALELERDKEQRSKNLYMLALLSADEHKMKFASMYEATKDTRFYQLRNCTITKDLVR
jgi:hypothetical protein